MQRLSHSGSSVTAMVLAGACLWAAGTAALEAGKAAAADNATEHRSSQAVASSNPLSGNPEAIDQGKHLYLTWCIQCHGANATGGKYGANLTIFSLGFKEFRATVQNGRVQKQMPPWKDVLDEDAITRIGAYLETLAQPEANWQ